jgi:hypothetical protein
MRKTILLLTSVLLASTALTANASYTVIYGDKQIGGDNIRFVKKTTAPIEPPAPVEECSKDQETRWVNGTPSFGIMYVMWNSVKVFPDVGNIYLTEYTYNGYKYTKGAQTANLGYYTFHSVCRVPI